MKSDLDQIIIENEKNKVVYRVLINASVDIYAAIADMEKRNDGKRSNEKD